MKCYYTIVNSPLSLSCVYIIEFDDVCIIQLEGVWHLIGTFNYKYLMMCVSCMIDRVCVNEVSFCMYVSFIWNGVVNVFLMGDNCISGIGVRDIWCDVCLWYPMIMGVCAVWVMCVSLWVEDVFEVFEVVNHDCAGWSLYCCRCCCMWRVSYLFCHCCCCHRQILHSLLPLLSGL